MLNRPMKILLVGYLLVLAPYLFAQAIDDSMLEEVHFLIPAGPGGGWDGTARGVGEALTKSGLVTDVSFENLSGGGGGRAIAKLIETGQRQQNTLLINSTPIVVRSLQKIFPQSFRDLVPIASVIADYSCFAVAKDSPIQNFADAARRLKADPRSVKASGGSVRGSTDHFILARAFELAGVNPRALTYVPYDGGGKAMAGLLTGETQMLSTGLSEAIDMARAGEIRIIAITAPERLPEIPMAPTLLEQGFDLTFANWRGFFAAPDLPPAQYIKMQNTIRQVINTDEFEKVRRRNGWSLLHYEGSDFYQFLERQETEIKSLMTKLGFLRPGT
ncbi:MAG: putative tricarboxylic transport membrane protein [Litorivivens sp.]|jgi:putative tricarboxylic transport membrane protein